ncbi:hypothetical protein CXF59_14105 [Flavobacterium sp. ALD4]|uniref:hypothetical protein n=1 Tax=Flavobacterium sp. ALD4 TaxID=2058314 RepID=UPI000C324728|nr:hypothetical protein [Flavobacterium sp. ALD4]PKH67026.1 hypothetical protein CXF59_14105 [Flavobacterium sp. ALD4]
MKKTIYILLSLVLLLLLAFATPAFIAKDSDIHLNSTNKLFVAGNDLELTFSSSSKTAKPQLFIIHSYGKTVVNGNNKDGKITFTIPDIYSKKTGNVSWFLIDNEKTVLNGAFEIIPNDKTKTQIENYLGPRSILAGGKEFTMMVSIPTDGFDNPKSENTPVLIKHQFLDKVTAVSKNTHDFVAWNNIYSNTQSGQILASTVCDKTITKETETEVYPNIATDFSIFYSRNHGYGDGNQITTLTTSIIKDEYNNTVSDGTMVVFHITTKNDMFLKTFGSTINGIATGQILHPDHLDSYAVKGYITGIAKSNILHMDYKPILSDFKYSFSDHNRKLTIGPLNSFMGQLVPDGIKVLVKIFHDDKIIKILQEDSSKGMANFEIPSDFYKEKNYRFEIQTLGITKKTETKNYVFNK